MVPLGYSLKQTICPNLGGVLTWREKLEDTGGQKLKFPKDIYNSSTLLIFLNLSKKRMTAGSHGLNPLIQLTKAV
jgi:hypothetical protein